MHKTLLPFAVVVVCSGILLPVLAAEKSSLPEFSGRYPHLGVFNHGGECGIGAVVPWADRLWLVTYSPHSPRGSNDKLYEIDGDLSIIRSGSRLQYHPKISSRSTKTKGRATNGLIRKPITKS